MAKHHRYGKRSKRILNELHPDLRKVMIRALEISQYDIGLTEGLRSKERQMELFRNGDTTTKVSEHFADADGWSRAVDFLGYKNNTDHYAHTLLRKIAGAIFQAAQELQVPIEWGGHWESFCDMPHIQLAKWYYK